MTFKALFANVRAFKTSFRTKVCFNKTNNFSNNKLQCIFFLRIQIWHGFFKIKKYAREIIMRQIFSIMLLIVTCSLRLYATESKSEQVFNDFKSPIETKARTIFYIGSTLTLALALSEDITSDPLQVEAIEHRPLGNTGTDLGRLAGAQVPNLVYTAGMLSYAYFTNDNKQRDRGNLMFRTLIYSNAATYLLKNIVREPRPDGSGEKDAFPSGHTNNAFAFASVIGAEHGWGWGTLAYTYATTVAYSRLNDNRHLLHHITGAATIGISYGLSLYYRSHNSNESPPAQNKISDFLFYPTDQLDGLSAIYVLRF